MVPILLINKWFGKRSYRLNRALNDRLEEEPDIVTNYSLPVVRRHFQRLRSASCNFE